MRETKTVEFKEALSDSFLKTVSAYANYGTGRILFGINDEGTTVGVSNPVDTALRIENKINDTINPRPDFSLDIDAETSVITLTVEEGKSKPYLYRSKAYKRNDSATIEVDPLEFRRLALEGENITFDSVKAKQQDLSFQTLERYLEKHVGVKEATEDVLKTLELFDTRQGYCIAAELLADTNSFPGIDIARFGESINVICNRKTFENISVLEQYERAVEMYRTYYVYEEIKGTTREEVQSIPEEAFREAIANALVHRTWDTLNHIRIFLQPERIEVISPGGLPAGITEEEYLSDRVSVLRNPILGNVFFRVGLIERFGTGVARINESYATSSAKPVFKVTANSISVILPLLKATPELAPDELVVYDVLQKDKGQSSSSIASASGFGRTKTVKILGSLAKDGYVKITGTGRGTLYLKA